MKTVIRLDKVSKSYTLGEKKITALKEFSFEVKSGEFVAVMGRSGSGKSTFTNRIKKRFGDDVVVRYRSSLPEWNTD